MTDKEVTQADVNEAIALFDLEKARELQYKLDKHERKKAREQRKQAGEHHD